MLLVLLCFGMGARAGNVLTIGSAQGAPGEEVSLALALENTDAVAALQVSIPLGEQLNYVEGSAAMTGRSNGHGVTAGVKDGTLNVMVYSLDMNALTGSTGDVVTLRLKLGNQPADVTLTATKVVMTDGSGNAIGDATSASGVVSIRCAKAEYSPMTIDFGRVPIRSTYNKSFTVRNTGNETLEVTGLQFSNYTTKFSSTTQFPLTVTPGSSTIINITYAPEERGTVNEEVKVLCNSISKLNNIALKAQPFAVNELHVQPVSGIADEVVTIPLTMNNMDAISGLQIEFQLPDALEYVENSFQLSDRKTNHVTVVTNKNGLLKILAYSPNDAAFADNDGEIGSFQVKLVGRSSVTLKPTKTVLSATIDNMVQNVCSEVYGATITIRSPRINARNSLNMGAVSVTEACEKTFTIRNSGNAPLTISRIVFDNENFSLKETLPLTIAAGSSQDVTVVYSGLEQTTFTGTMQIYSNDPQQRVWNVTVSGSRFAPNYFDISTEDVSAFDNLRIDVAVNTYDPIVGLQFDLVYPGTYYEPFSNNYTLEPRAEGMTVTYRQIDANTLRYFCYFLTGDGIAAGEGKAMTLQLKPKGEFVPEGEYSVSVTNIKLGTSELADKYAGSDCESTFTVFYPVTSISITPSPASLDKGQTLQLVAAVNEEATYKGVVWSSADEGIVTISADGIITAVDYGTTIVTATAESNPEVSATCDVTVVYVPVTSISISQTTATLEGGESVKLEATVNEDASNKNIIWTSANESVATVKTDGTVVGLHIGTTTITGTSEANPDLTVTCEVTVTSNLSIPVPFEFYYNAENYDANTHSIPNHPLANLKDASLVLSNNLPEFIDNELLRISNSCWGSIDCWDKNSTQSGAHFYRSGQDCMTIVCKVAPNYGNGGNASDFISNRGGGYNYMWRIGHNGKMYLHTNDAYNASRSLNIGDNEPQILAIRVDGQNNYIKLENLTTGETLRVNQVNWGNSNNIFRLFCSNSPNSEWFKGDFYWVYYSFELLTDEQLEYFVNSGVLKGDVNNDGFINLTDADWVVKHFVGRTPSGFNYRAADVDEDGNINLTDARLIVNMFIGRN